MNLWEEMIENIIFIVKYIIRCVERLELMVYFLGVIVSFKWDKRYFSYSRFFKSFYILI